MSDLLNSFKKNNVSKSLAFTLAEVLITLAVIGVIAAMTIPTMVANYQKTQYVTQLKKAYTELSQALQQMMVDEGVEKVSATDVLTHDGVEDYDTAIQRAGNQFLKKYFKIAKDCGTDSGQFCFAQDYYSIDKIDGPYDLNTWGVYRVITAYGIGIAIQCATQGSPGKIFVDINGLQKPNIAGRDLFCMSFYYDGTLDVVTPECKKGLPTMGEPVCKGAEDAFQLRNDRAEDNIRSFSGYGSGFGKILNDNWKMDY